MRLLTVLISVLYPKHEVIDSVDKFFIAQAWGYWQYWYVLDSPSTRLLNVDTCFIAQARGYWQCWYVLYSPSMRLLTVLIRALYPKHEVIDGVVVIVRELMGKNEPQPSQTLAAAAIICFCNTCIIVFFSYALWIERLLSFMMINLIFEYIYIWQYCILKKNDYFKQVSLILSHFKWTQFVDNFAISRNCFS